MKGEEIMISVLTHDMLSVADVSAMLGLYKNGYVHIEPRIKKLSIIDLGIEKKDIMALSDLNLSINIFSGKFNLNQLLSINSDAYLLIGRNKEIENMDCLLKKVKKLIEKKTLIGIDTGKEVLETAIKDLGEDNWQEGGEVKKHCRYEIYCMDNSSLGEINKII